MTMTAVPAVLLALAAAVGLVPGAIPGVERAAARFADHGAYGQWVLGSEHVSWPGMSATHLQGSDVLYALLAPGRGRSPLPRWGCSDDRYANLSPGGSRTPHETHCVDCATSIRAISATTSRGGPPVRARLARSACSRSHDWFPKNSRGHLGLHSRREILTVSGIGPVRQRITANPSRRASPAALGPTRRSPPPPLPAVRRPRTRLS